MSLTAQNCCHGGKYSCWKGYYSWRRNVDLVVRMGSMGSGFPDGVPMGSLSENWILVCPWNRLSCLTTLKAWSLMLRTALFTRKWGKRKGGLFFSCCRINTDSQMDSVQRVRPWGALGPQWMSLSAPSFQPQGSMWKRTWRVSKRQRWQMTQSRQCSTDTAGLRCTWTHRDWQHIQDPDRFKPENPNTRRIFATRSHP